MSNICAFAIEATGEPAQLQALKQYVERGIEKLEAPMFEKYVFRIDLVYDDLQDDDLKFVWLDDRKPGPNYEQYTVADGPFWFSGDYRRILLHGTSKWAPPKALVERLSRQYPDLDFTFGGTTEHEVSENWTCKGGVSRCEWYVVQNIQEEKQMWYVRDGQQVHPLEWIDGDKEEMATLEAKVDDLLKSKGDSAWARLHRPVVV